ncbi:MAG: amino acid permease [Gemmatimonadota bacterium]|jgi:APA family basic amino acid/polyamine antiporter|nr:amino acid permease [Gemmatimonadota bacterium]
MADQRDAYGERLPRSVGLLGAVAVLVGTTIGSGIFRVPATVATRLGDPTWFLVAWVLGGLLALFGALTLAELASMYPRSGGVFAFLEEGVGPLPAFLFGWSQLVVIRASALGAIATIFAEYLGYFIPLSPRAVQYVAALVILAVGLLNYIGVKRAGAVMNVATVAKYGAMVLLVLLAFGSGTGDAGHFASNGTGFQLSLMGTAIVPIMWAYDGWADLTYMSGEVKDPNRTLPRALIIGTLLIIAIYLSVNAAYLYLVPISEMAGQPLIASTAANRIPLLGGAGGAMIAAVVMLSTFSSVNGSMMTSPRIFFAMADRGLFFKGIARVSPRFQSPSAAIWLATGLGVTYVLFNNFQQLADKFVLGIWPFYIVAVVGVFLLRRRRPDAERPYRAFGYPLVPAVFLIAATFMVVNALVTDPVNTGITFAIILAGVPVYLVRGGRKAIKS